MDIIFDQNAKENDGIKEIILEFLGKVSTLETKLKMPIVVFQDGADESYYIRCSINAKDTKPLCDLNAKLDWIRNESFRANRELYKSHHTYKRMVEDAGKGREFNDIIVEYNIQYYPEKPLKVWGGQHRISAIIEAGSKFERYHGFKIYFGLNKNQRNKIALISNTNINVSNDTFDRMIEETLFGDKLRSWCVKIGLLEGDENFPDVGSKSEKITVKKARNFILNYYLGLKRGSEITTLELDKHYYEPQLVKSGVEIDSDYTKIMQEKDILSDAPLIEAGKNFALLHKTQYLAVSKNNDKINNLKRFRNKALIDSVVCGWAYIAGLLQSHRTRLENHYELPKTNNQIPDPLNAFEMSKYKHDSDEKTYRGLGTRTTDKDRQRIAQLFLAKSINTNSIIDKALMDKAVSQVVGLASLEKGYAK